MKANTDGHLGRQAGRQVAGSRSGAAHSGIGADDTFSTLPIFVFFPLADVI